MRLALAHVNRTRASSSSSYSSHIRFLSSKTACDPNLQCDLTERMQMLPEIRTMIHWYNQIESTNKKRKKQTTKYSSVREREWRVGDGRSAKWYRSSDTRVHCLYMCISLSHQFDHMAGCCCSSTLFATRRVRSETAHRTTTDEIQNPSDGTRLINCIS